ncbi:MAG: TerB N-terminal domain-containing protein [Clostridia bacterium]|nr:TerB N-terminal domain-containing protein [Clostridia bacterium]
MQDFDRSQKTPADLTADAETAEKQQNRNGFPPGEKSAPAQDADDNFWNLPPIHKRTYSPPTYDGRTTDTIPVSVEEERTARTEVIPPRDPAKAPAATRPVRPADRTWRTSTYSTSRGYQNRMQEQENGKTYGFGEQDKKDAYQTFRDIDASHGNAVPGRSSGRSSAGEIVSERTGRGWLIRQVTVRRWINDFSFYTGFARDAAISHSRQGTPSEPVPYHSFVPQYSQMDSRQLAFYLWFRDNARAGVYLEADFPYILLYIFEIINLPERIAPADGIEQICRIWAHYRRTYQKLDTYLCEWIPDYALIHDVPLPGSIEPFLADIVRRAQFKEFYLDNMCPPDGKLSRRALEVLAGVLLETYSDYDYKKSRYYTGGSREQYDRCILEALTAVLEKACADSRGMFALDRIYRLTRDSFCGAIIQTEGKRRIDVAFNSCIRSPDTRRFVTGIVKYAENRLRYRLKIKSKLNASEISAEDKALVDAYFGPDEAPVRKKTAQEEEAYLKLYEAETTGFDFSAAHQIEAASWVNTSRLTGEETDTLPFSTAEALPYVPEEDNAPVEGAMDSEDPVENRAVFPLPEELSAQTEPVPAENRTISDPVKGSPAEDIGQTDPFAEVAAMPAGERHSLEKEAVAALLAGQFQPFCRDHGLFPGRMAEQINEIFLELVGDILIEADGNRYQLIEDYREDAESWSKA